MSAVALSLETVDDSVKSLIGELSKKVDEQAREIDLLKKELLIGTFNHARLADDYQHAIEQLKFISQ